MKFFSGIRNHHLNPDFVSWSDHHKTNTALKIQFEQLRAYFIVADNCLKNSKPTCYILVSVKICWFCADGKWISGPSAM